MSILVIFVFDAMAGQKVDLVPVALIGGLVVAAAAILIASYLTPAKPLATPQVPAVREP